MINLGYCCVSMLYPKLRTSRASTKTHLESLRPEICAPYLKEKATENIKDLCTLLKENVKNEIYAYRVPEQILPQVDLGYYTVDEMEPLLYEAGQIANQYGIQLSTHPSQYYVLNSMREEVVDKTVMSLNMIGEMFECMKLDKTPNITLHIGMKSSYGNEQAALDAFCRGFEKCNDAVKHFLVIENDHVSFCVEDCIELHKLIGIPIVFDNKHYEWNQGNLEYNEALSLAVHTWGKRIPKLHLSSDRDAKMHAHSDYVNVSDFLRMEHALEKAKIDECYVMMECKQKDKAVLKLRKELAAISF